MFAYGIPNFYCETSYNLDLRQAFNTKEGDFWPHVSTGIPDDWVQESYVSIANDNTYTYNTTFSKQNTENFFSHLPDDYKDNFCLTNYPFRTIYSEPQNTNSDNRINNWLVYKPLSFFDFPQNYGKLTSLDGIQNKAVLARFENKTLLYNNLLTVDTSNPQAAYFGNPNFFRTDVPPIDFAETDLGYVGSQNKFLLKIPQGQITVDAKRGQVFLIEGTQAADLSAFGSGMNRFFTDHLAFEILRYFPEVPADNHFTGIGLHGVFDSKFERVIITKLDYIPIDKDVKYDAVKNEFYIETVTYVDAATTTTSTSTSSTTTTSTSSTTTTSTTSLTPTTTTTTTNCCTLADVTIGTQIWTACNLSVTTYRDETPIPQVQDPTAWANLTTGAWCWYNNIENSCYGKLYNWYAVAGIYDAASAANPALRKQLAPVGYHIPTKAEKEILEATTYPYEGGSLKQVGTANWNPPNALATNTTGFTAISPGSRSNGGNFVARGDYANWWTTTASTTTNAWAYYVYSIGGGFPATTYNKGNGLSIRLIKD